MENQKWICVAICFGSSNHFTGLLLVLSFLLHMDYRRTSSPEASALLLAHLVDL